MEKAATVIYTFKCDTHPELQSFVKSVRHDSNTCHIVCVETEDHSIARMLRSNGSGLLSFEFDIYTDSGQPPFTSFHFDAYLPHPQEVFKSVDSETEELLYHIELKHIRITYVKNQFGA